MKRKLFAALLILAIGVLVVGCEDDDEFEVANTKVGGWELNVDVEDSNLPDDAEDIFEKTVKTSEDIKLEPISLLATQVVSGTNYMYFAKGVKDKTMGYYVVVIYKDLKGNTEISKLTEFDLLKYVNKDIPNDTESGNLMGGWTIHKENDDSPLEDDAEDVFNEGTKGLLGVNYTPLELLATQVVSGRNYAILTISETVTENPVTSIDVLTIYKDTQNNVSLQSVAYVDLKEFNK